MASRKTHLQIRPIARRLNVLKPQDSKCLIAGDGLNDGIPLLPELLSDQQSHEYLVLNDEDRQPPSRRCLSG
jgi:hypothetical protein